MAEKFRKLLFLMFTGIIEQTGKIEKIDGNRFTIAMQDYEITRLRDNEKIKIGESIAVSGACLTVLESKENSFTVEIMAESCDRTTFANAQVGDTVNLERAVVIGARNSGHFVTGHIDEVGKILKISHDRDYWRFRISFSPKNSVFLVEKGSVAVDGISLTIASLDSNPKNSGFESYKLGDAWFEVGIISHTFDVTNLSQKKEGDTVNLEFDILGKYIAKSNQSFPRRRESSE